MRSTDPPTPAEADELAAEHREDLLRNALSHIALKAIPCGACGAVHVRREDGSKARFTWADPNDGHYYAPLTPEAYAKATLAKLDRAGEGGD